MADDIKLLVVAGARPNFMKIAPLVHAVRAHNAGDAPRIDLRLVHTGQHYDVRMSKVFFDELQIPEPDFNLEVGSGSHAVQTANVMLKFEPVCEEVRPHWVIVVGDVNSTVACTLVASKLGLRVAHVEAGLRSFDRTMPEEINRLVTDSIADLLLTPSEDADLNLAREGVHPSKIKCVGNIMIDCLVANLSRARQSPILEQAGVRPLGFVYVTLHRPSNVDDPESLRGIMAELNRLELPVIFPMHPRTRKRLAEFNIDVCAKHVRVLEPIGYHDSLCLTENARLVLTDSGGLQEESTFFRTPCLTLRPNTERPVTITIGSNRLTTPARLTSDMATLLSGDKRLGAAPPLWDGKTAARIVAALLEPR
jgi:UDP-N-acetylglucosamine 2-epimerase (non-hydrolysing)